MLLLMHSRDPASPIICELEHKALGEHVHYAALSYTWGSNVRTDSITLGGIAFPVTSNLFAALHAVRDKESNCFIWVDAICINQNDIC